MLDSNATRHLLRCVTLAASFLSLLTAGSLFSFGSFSEDLRARFGFSARDINVISATGLTALYTPFLIIGPIYDRFGGRVTMAMSTLTFTFGFFMMYLAYQGAISAAGQTVAAISFYYFMAGWGSCSSFMACFAVNITNFAPTYSGVLSGILGIFYSLSATVYAQIYAAKYSTDTGGFLLFMAISVGIVNSIATVFMASIKYDGRVTTEKEVAESEHQDDSAIKGGSAEPEPPVLSTVTSGGLDGRGDDVQNIDKIEPEHQDENASPLSDEKDKGNQPADEAGGSVDPDADGAAKSDVTVDGRVVEDIAEEFAEIDMTPLEILKSGTFWLYAISFFLLTGLTYFNNVGTIVKVLAGPGASTGDVSSSTSLQVTLLSVSQCIARATFGVGSDVLVARFRFDRSFLFFVGQVVTAVPYLIITIAPKLTPPLLTFASITTGFSYGAVGAMLTPLTRDFFGARHIGTAIGFVMCAIPLCIFAANVIFGSLYDAADARGCTDVDCFRVPFGVFLAVQVIPVILSLWLYVSRNREAKRGRARVSVAKNAIVV